MTGLLFGERLRFDLSPERREKVLPCRGARTNSGTSGTRNLEAESRSRAGRTSHHQSPVGERCRKRKHSTIFLEESSSIRRTF